MNERKTPIWERQGRPKPPSVGYDNASYAYSEMFTRWSVCRQTGCPEWGALSPAGDYTGFPTFAEAIAYADREARRLA